jgi:hypothetical protein
MFRLDFHQAIFNELDLLFDRTHFLAKLPNALALFEVLASSKLFACFIGKGREFELVLSDLLLAASKRFGTNPNAFDQLGDLGKCVAVIRDRLFEFLASFTFGIIF